MKAPVLSSLPNSSRVLEKNQWADYIELACLTSLDKEVSLSDILSLYSSEGQNDNLDGNDLSASRKDKISSEFEDVFKYISSRQSIFNEYYPFHLIDSDTISMFSAIDNKKLFYIFLLCASNTKYFAPTDRNPFTTAFEQVSAKILSLLYPSFRTEVFGTASEESNLFSGGTLLQKLEKLAECVNSKLTDSTKRNPRYKSPSGDGGLDIVSFLQVDFPASQASRVPICLGQCACSYRDWIKKQSEASCERWSQKIIPLTKCHEYIFVPFPLRDVNGQWAPEEDDKMTVNVIDRMRIVSILELHGNDLTFFISNRVYPDFVNMFQSLDIAL